MHSRQVAPVSTDHETSKAIKLWMCNQCHSVARPFKAIEASLVALARVGVRVQLCHVSLVACCLELVLAMEVQHRQAVSLTGLGLVQPAPNQRGCSGLGPIGPPQPNSPSMAINSRYRTQPGAHAWQWPCAWNPLRWGPRQAMANASPRPGNYYARELEWSCVGVRAGGDGK